MHHIPHLRKRVQGVIRNILDSTLDFCFMHLHYIWFKTTFPRKNASLCSDSSVSFSTAHSVSTEFSLAYLQAVRSACCFITATILLKASQVAETFSLVIVNVLSLSFGEKIWLTAFYMQFSSFPAHVQWYLVCTSFGKFSKLVSWIIFHPILRWGSPFEKGC